MIILGIDPGTKRVGFGLVEKREGGKVNYLAAGLLEVSGASDAEILLDIKKEIDHVIETFGPEMLGIEKLFFMKNQKTGMQVAEARGVLLLAAMEHGLKIVEFAPSEAKAALTGYGSADKKSMLKMVRLILKRPDLELIDDASDALAIAICAADRLRFSGKKS